MKILILGNCNHLIKYLLFNQGPVKNKYSKEKVEIRHVPRNKLWPGKKYIKDKELDIIVNNMDDNDKMIPENDLELAIYHCKGNFNLKILQINLTYPFNL